MKELFENRRLTGKIKIACKYENAPTRFWQDEKENIIARIVSIVEAYQAQNYRLTLRQLHYQFVGHDPLYVNHDSAYKKLGNILDDCRYSGVIDWDSIEDRGRVPKLPYFAEDIPDAFTDILGAYRLDRQKGQENYIELWTEKDALSGIMQRSTFKYHVNLVVNKGYTSSSAIYNAYERFCERMNNGQNVIILYFGDHDPSGLDMVRDVEERLEFMFQNGEQYSPGDSSFEVQHIGLTKAQVKQYKLPPNPTKLTDSRAAAYIKIHGKTCWEVDALEPRVLTELIESNIESNIDMEEYTEQMNKEKKDKKAIQKFIDSYEEE